MQPTQHNFIPLVDRAVLIPVTKCNATVVQEEVGAPESVFVDIWTNGTVHPREALQAGLRKLATTFLALAKESGVVGLV